MMPCNTGDRWRLGPTHRHDSRLQSAWLTGAAAPDLDSGMASKLLAGFLANGRSPGLALLSSDTQVNTGTVANDIVAAWYSGLYDTPSGQAVAGFTDALMWNALAVVVLQAKLAGSRID